MLTTTTNTTTATTKAAKAKKILGRGNISLNHQGTKEARARKRALRQERQGRDAKTSRAARDERLDKLKKLQRVKLDRKKSKDGCFYGATVQAKLRRKKLVVGATGKVNLSVR